MSMQSSSSGNPSQPPPLFSSPPPPPAASKRKAKQPDPAELIAFYEEKGLDSKAAAHQAILDLQKVLTKVVSQVRNSPARKNEALTADINTRLAILEMKLDSKPGMGQMLGLQLTATAIVQTVPHVFKAFGNIWSSVRNSTKH